MTKQAQDLLLGELPDEAVTGSVQEEAPKKARGGKRRGLRRLLRRRKKAAAVKGDAAASDEEQLAPAASAITLEERSVEEEAALDARLAEVLDGGFAVPSAKEVLKKCLSSEEACDLEAELENQTQLGLIVRK